MDSSRQTSAGTELWVVVEKQTSAGTELWVVVDKRHPVLNYG